MRHVATVEVDTYHRTVLVRRRPRFGSDIRFSNHINGHRRACSQSLCGSGISPYTVAAA
eukprot:SAG31_NODE_26507_length_441_cov_0.745614_1_plen_58_part_01